MKRILIIICIFISVKTFAQWQCGNMLIDSRDSKSYTTIQIGNQCWMAENLNYGSKIDYNDTVATPTNSSIIEKYCPNNQTELCDSMGGIYEWNEMMQGGGAGAQGVCPSGWHVPTHIEYDTLFSNYSDKYAAYAALKNGGGSGFEWYNYGQIAQSFNLWKYNIYNHVNYANCSDKMSILPYNINWKDNYQFVEFTFYDDMLTFLRCIKNSTPTSTGSNTIDINPSNIYPNPFSSQAVISFSNPLNKTLELKVFDASGKEIKVISELSSNQLIIRKGKLPSGVYYYQLTTGTEYICKGNMIIE